MAKKHAFTARIFGCAAGVGVVLALAGYLGTDRGPETAFADSAVRAAPALPAPIVVQELVPLSEEQAIAANAALPFALHAIEVAPAFRLSNWQTHLAGYDAAVDCLAQAVYYEASGESLQGQRAVAQVVLNRVRHPAFPTSICEVVYQGSERTTGCQFTFTCDGSLARKPAHQGWARARSIASAALAGAVEPTVGMATHYHANRVFPYWAPTLDKLAAIGAHVFYRWTGHWGKRSAFSQPYTGEAAPFRFAMDAHEQAAAAMEVSVLAGSEPQTSVGLEGRTWLIADLRQSEGAALVADQTRPALQEQSRGRLIADQSESTLRADQVPPPKL